MKKVADELAWFREFHHRVSEHNFGSPVDYMQPISELKNFAISKNNCKKSKFPTKSTRKEVLLQIRENNIELANGSIYYSSDRSSRDMINYLRKEENLSKVDWPCIVGFVPFKFRYFLRSNDGIAESPFMDSLLVLSSDLVGEVRSDSPRLCFTCSILVDSNYSSVINGYKYELTPILPSKSQKLDILPSWHPMGGKAGYYISTTVGRYYNGVFCNPTIFGTFGASSFKIGVFIDVETMEISDALTLTIMHKRRKAFNILFPSSYYFNLSSLKDLEDAKKLPKWEQLQGFVFWEFGIDISDERIRSIMGLYITEEEINREFVRF